MIHLTINPCYQKEVDTEMFDQVLSKTLDHLSQQEVDVSVVLESDPFLRKLNQDYRGIDQPTDVLSFEMDHIDPETGIRYLGDIIISMDTAQRQALKRNLPFMSEVSLLFLHGLLHLYGFDHMDKKEADEMWNVQGQILRLVGLDPDLVNPELSEQ